MRERYADFAPTLAAEYLAQEDLLVSRETLGSGCQASPGHACGTKKTMCGEPRASFGELGMQDELPIPLAGETGPACQLIALLDDATSRI